MAGALTAMGSASAGDSACGGSRGPLRLARAPAPPQWSPPVCSRSAPSPVEREHGRSRRGEAKDEEPSRPGSAAVRSPCLPVAQFSESGQGPHSAWPLQGLLLQPGAAGKTETDPLCPLSPVPPEQQLELTARTAPRRKCLQRVSAEGWWGGGALQMRADPSKDFLLRGCEELQGAAEGASRAGRHWGPQGSMVHSESPGPRRNY